MSVIVDSSLCGRALEIPDMIFKDVSPDISYCRYTREKRY